MKNRIVAAWKVLRGELEAIEPCREAPPASRPITPMWVYTDTMSTGTLVRRTRGSDMEFILNTLARSSWGVLPLHTGIGLAVLAVAAVLAWFLLRASWRPQAWRGESGQGLVEVLLVVFLAVADPVRAVPPDLTMRASRI
jgi:hypothetical protein